MESQPPGGPESDEAYDIALKPQVLRPRLPMDLLSQQRPNAADEVVPSTRSPKRLGKGDSAVMPIEVNKGKKKQPQSGKGATSDVCRTLSVINVKVHDLRGAVRRREKERDDYDRPRFAKLVTLVKGLYATKTPEEFKSVYGDALASDRELQQRHSQTEREKGQLEAEVEVITTGEFSESSIITKHARAIEKREIWLECYVLNADPEVQERFEEIKRERDQLEAQLTTPEGFPTSVAIIRYARAIEKKRIWLEANVSNADPEVWVRYDQVKREKGRLEAQLKAAAAGWLSLSHAAKDPQDSILTKYADAIDEKKKWLKKNPDLAYDLSDLFHNRSISFARQGSDQKQEREMFVISCRRTDFLSEHPTLTTFHLDDIDTPYPVPLSMILRHNYWPDLSPAIPSDRSSIPPQILEHIEIIHKKSSHALNLKNIYRAAIDDPTIDVAVLEHILDLFVLARIEKERSQFYDLFVEAKDEKGRGVQGESKEKLDAHLTGIQKVLLGKCFSHPNKLIKTKLRIVFFSIGKLRGSYPQLPAINLASKSSLSQDFDLFTIFANMSPEDLRLSKKIP
jgi:hypothetical protein